MFLQLLYSLKYLFLSKNEDSHNLVIVTCKRNLKEKSCNSRKTSFKCNSFLILCLVSAAREERKY